MQLYHNPNASDVDSFLAQGNRNPAQPQRKGVGCGKNADIGYKSMPVIKLCPYKMIHLVTHLWTSSDIQCLPLKE
jgi:hypothetical protein